MLDIKSYKLVVPDKTYEHQYTKMMDKWEFVEDNIQPELLRRYSKSLGRNVSYSKWLEWCKDDRATGSMLSTGVPCTLYFLVDDNKEIFGSIVVNSSNTHRGHLHAGIVPWHRGKGVGTIMLRLALRICRDNGLTSVEIVTDENNEGAIKTILNSGGVLKEKFFEDGRWSLRYIVSTELQRSENFIFNNISKENISSYKKLRKIFVKYKIKTLRNHGETPASKKIFNTLFDNIVLKTSVSDSEYFIVMQSGKEIIGFALISTKADDVIDIPYGYGTVNDFYISPKHRRKGYGRILNDYVESIFKANGTNTVLLYPDPVYGIPFWKAMKYLDTGIHQGWGHYLVYIKHLTQNERSVDIDNAISKLVTSTDLIGISPYNKPQIKEVYGVWKEYCKKENRKPRKSDVGKMARNARKNKSISFRALYFKGRIVGFIYNNGNQISYILSEHKDLHF